MITWMGFVGKLIDLMVNRIVGKKIDLALDDKKRAAKAFVRFHEATVRLETILTAFLTYIDTFVEKSESIKPPNRTIYTENLNRRIRDLRSASEEFLESLAEVGDVLYFFDRPLASLLGEIRVRKMDLYKNIYFFFAVSVREEMEVRYGIETDPKAVFRPTFEPGSLSGIEYTIPSEDLMELDLVEEFGQFSRNLDVGKFNVSVPREIQDLVMDIIKSNLESGYIGPKDAAKLIELGPRLHEHRNLLIQAREKLRDFIEARFSIADILYVIK
jgi:hypothetical protein